MNEWLEGWVEGQMNGGWVGRIEAWRMDKQMFEWMMGGWMDGQ